MIKGYILPNFSSRIIDEKAKYHDPENSGENQNDTFDRGIEYIKEIGHFQISTTPKSNRNTDNCNPDKQIDRDLFGKCKTPMKEISIYDIHESDDSHNTE